MNELTWHRSLAFPETGWVVWSSAHEDDTTQRIAARFYLTPQGWVIDYCSVWDDWHAVYRLPEATTQEELRERTIAAYIAGRIE